MDLLLREATERIGSEDALAKIDVLLDWPWFSPLLKRALGRSGVAPQGYSCDRAKPAQGRKQNHPQPANALCPLKTQRTKTNEQNPQSTKMLPVTRTS
jgi:hypothetical protein